MTQIIFLYITREFFFNILHTMNCFVTYSKSCKHLSLSLSSISTFTPLFIPSFSHFHSFSLPHPTQCHSLFLSEILHPEGRPRGPESHSIQTSPVHTNLRVQRVGLGSQKNIQALQHRGWASEPKTSPVKQSGWWAEISSHKPCDNRRWPGELKQVHTSPMIQRTGPGSQGKWT